jgi:hypothetical protein
MKPAVQRSPALVVCGGEWLKQHWGKIWKKHLKHYFQHYWTTFSLGYPTFKQPQLWLMIQQPLSQFLLLPRPGVPLSGLRWMRFKARNLSSAKSLGVTTCYDHIKNELEVMWIINGCGWILWFMVDKPIWTPTIQIHIFIINHTGWAPPVIFVGS